VIERASSHLVYNSNFKQTSPTLSPQRHSSLTLSILFILISQYLHLSQVYDCTPITIHSSPYIHTPLLTTSTLPAPLTCTSHRPDPPSRLFPHLVSKIIVAIVDPPNLGRRPEHIFFGLLRPYCAPPPAWLTVPTYYGQRPRSPKLHHCIGRGL
jgi:hypothetical protein